VAIVLGSRDGHCAEQSGCGSREHDWPGGRFRGFDAPAGTYVRDTAFAYRLVAGRIAERWAIRDDLAMLLQLGAIRPPG
jgi:hypothetical protein